jgi:plasmid rolling circle replication initiator protein Rep
MKNFKNVAITQSYYTKLLHKAITQSYYTKLLHKAMCLLVDSPKNKFHILFRSS